MFRTFVFVVFIAGLSACSIPPEVGINDPHETVNRQSHEINKALDTRFVRPIAVAYSDNIPADIQIVINNVADNYSLPSNVANHLLQGELNQAVAGVLRFGINMTLGLGGIAKPADHFSIFSEATDFGETLAKWGVKEGPYVEMIAFGPTTQRDGIGKIVDIVMNPIGQLGYGVSGIAAVSQAGSGFSYRGKYRQTIDSVLYDSADSYAQSRLLYLQNRRHKLGADITDQDVDPYEDLYE